MDEDQESGGLEPIRIVAAPLTLSEIKREMAENPDPIAMNTRPSIRSIQLDDQSDELAASSSENIVRAQLSFHKDRVMTQKFASGSASCSKDPLGKPARSNKKRLKRQRIVPADCPTNQAMQIVPPPCSTGSDFLYRRNVDIDIIGDMDGMDVDVQDTGIALVAREDRPVSTRESHKKAVEKSMSLSMQEYFMRQMPDANNGESSDSTAIFQQHIHATGGRAGGSSFVINLAMNEMGGNTCVSLDMLADYDALMAKVRDISRAEEERFLRQIRPGSGERECIKGMACEGYFIFGAAHKFALVEYQWPESREHFARTGSWSEPQGMCIMCMRRAACFVYFNIASRCIPHDYSSVEQAMELREQTKNPKPHNIIAVASFANRVGVNEYGIHDIIFGGPTQCVPLFKPIVNHTRFKYRQIFKDGLWFYEQTYAKPSRNLWDGVDPVCASGSSSTASGRQAAAPRR
jgi:hypothetical protein